MVHVKVPDETPRRQIVVGATPTTGPWTFDFTFFTTADIDVYVGESLVPEVETTDYTITGNAGTEGGFEGGSITMAANISSTTLTLILNIPIERDTDFPTSGPFDIEALNTDLDRLTAIAAQVQLLYERAVRLTPADTATDLTVPVLSGRANRTMIFSADGLTLENGPTASEVEGAQAEATAAAASAAAALVSELAAAVSAAAAAASAALIALPLAISSGGTGAATASAARTALGLALGSDVQAYNALTAIRNVKQAWTKNQYFTEQAITYNTAPTINFDDGAVAHITATGDFTDMDTNITNVTGTCEIWIFNGGTARSVTGWDAAIVWTDTDTIPTQNTSTATGACSKWILEARNGAIYGSKVDFG